MSKISSKAETKVQQGFKNAGTDLMTPVTAAFEKSAVVLRPKRSLGEFAKRVARRTSSLAQRRVTIKSPNTPNSKIFYLNRFRNKLVTWFLLQTCLLFKQAQTIWIQLKMMYRIQDKEFHSMKALWFLRPMDLNDTVSVKSQEKYQITFPERFHLLPKKNQW